MFPFYTLIVNDLKIRYVMSSIQIISGDPMRFLSVLFFTLIFSNFAHAGLKERKVCFRNQGAYVANVKFTIMNYFGKEVVDTKEHRRINSLTSKDYCVYYNEAQSLRDAHIAQSVKVYVEHYMFLGNATLKKTCEFFYQNGGWLVEAQGTTINASCYTTEF